MALSPCLFRICWLSKTNKSGYEPLNLENGSKAPSTFSPRNLKRQADFQPEIWITRLPNQTQDKLRSWCFFSWHSIEDLFKIQVLTAIWFSRNAAVKATCICAEISCAKESRCLLHPDWMHSLALPNQRGVTAWLRMSFQNVTNSIVVRTVS